MIFFIHVERWKSINTSTFSISNVFSTPTQFALYSFDGQTFFSMAILIIIYYFQYIVLSIVISFLYNTIIYNVYEII